MLSFAYVAYCSSDAYVVVVCLCWRIVIILPVLALVVFWPIWVFCSNFPYCSFCHIVFLPVLAHCSCSLMMAYFVALPIYWHIVIVCLLALVVILPVLAFCSFCLLCCNVV